MDYRNPTVAAVLAQLGFVQRFGVGIEIARKRLADNGNPPLQLTADTGVVDAVIGLVS